MGTKRKKKKDREVNMDINIHETHFFVFASNSEVLGFPVAQLVKNLPAMWEMWVGKISWRREWVPTPVFWPGEFHGLYSLCGHR